MKDTKTKIEKNTKALDTKMSSAFLLYGRKKGFYITQECYDKIMSLELYRICEETGEEILHRDLNYRAVVLVYKLHKLNCDKKLNETNWKYYGADSLREFSDKYYVQILNKLQEAEIINIQIKHKTLARKIWINEKCLSDKKLVIKDANYWNVVRKLNKKAYTNGKRHTTEKKVHIDISKDGFLELFKGDIRYKEDDYLELWNNVERINEIGEVSACQKRNKRSYSLFTSLPSRIHDKVTIDGRHLCEMDGHCTYFSFLPAVIDIEIKKRIKRPFKTMKDQDFLEKLIEDNAKLRQTIRNTTDIYNLFVDETYDRNYIKTIFNSFLNDPVYKDYYDVVKNYIEVNFPSILQVLNTFRENNKFFYAIQRVEVDIYIRTAKNLKKSKGIDFLCKHDGLLFYVENLETVRNELIKNMNRRNVFQNLKIIDHSINDQPTVVNPADSVAPLKDQESVNKNNYFSQFFLPSITTDFTSLSGANLERSSLSGAKSRDREVFIKNYRNGFRISIKKKYYYSEKNDTIEEFYKKLMNNEEISKDVKKLIKFNDDERSECRNEETANKTLTPEIKNSTIEMPVGDVLSQDVEKMTNDIETLQNSPTEPETNQSEELSDFERYILKRSA